MSSLNSRLRPVGSASAISRTTREKQTDLSPELKQKAAEITEEVLSRLREPVRRAVVHALQQQRNDSTAKIWIERRIFRPAQQALEQAVRIKKATIPPPSSRPEKPDPENTGTWRKASASKKSIPPSTGAVASKRDEAEQSTGALKRALSRPDRASVRPSKRPTPPPPGLQEKRKRETPIELPGLPTAPESQLSAPPSSRRELVSHENSNPLVGPISEHSLPRLDQKLSALPFLDTPKEQAIFLLDLILTLAPAKSILFHLVDPRSQAATVISVHGKHAGPLSDWTTEPQDPLLTQLRRLRRPVRITTPTVDERCSTGRWVLVEPKKYIVALPVLHEHKLLGFIELADPLEGNRFSQSQLDAVEELAQAWGQRLTKA